MASKGVIARTPCCFHNLLWLMRVCVSCSEPCDTAHLLRSSASRRPCSTTETHSDLSEVMLLYALPPPRPDAVPLRTLTHQPLRVDCYDEGRVPCCLSLPHPLRDQAAVPYDVQLEQQARVLRRCRNLLHAGVCHRRHHLRQQHPQDTL